MGGTRSFASAGLLVGISLAIGFAVPPRANDDWRPINPADLALKDNPSSPGSQAMFLYREEYTDTRNSYVRKYYRIKIFNAAGKKYGDVEIPFNKSAASIQDLKARTILPNGTVVDFMGKPFEKVVVKTKGLKVYEAIFTFPSVQPGCIIEYKYRLKYHSGYYYRGITWDIQGDLFTREAHFTIRPPRGPDAPSFYWRAFNFSQPVLLLPQKDGTYTLTMHNVPPLKQEPYTMPDNMRRGRVQFSFRPNMPETVGSFWNEKAKQWAHDLNHRIDKKKQLQQVVDQTTSPNDPPMVKLRKLYARAQQIRNIDWYPIGPAPTKTEKLKDNHNVGDVLKHGYGNDFEINILFLGLARAAGLDARVVLFAARDRTMFFPSLENPYELSGNIVVVSLNGKNLFLDPGSPDYPFSLLKWNEAGIKGLAISKKGAEFINIPSTTAEEALTERHADLTLDAKGALNGTLEIEFTGIRGAAVRQAERGEGQSDRRKDLSDIIDPWLPSGGSFHITSVTGWRHPSGPLRVKGKLTIPGYGTGLGKRLLVPLVPFTSKVAGAFHSPTRVNDVYFNYPFENRDDITLHLPVGYKVESLPKLPSISGRAFVYTVTAAKQSDTLHVARDLKVRGFYFPVKYYSLVRSFFSTVKTGDDDQAVLEASVAGAGH